MTGEPRGLKRDLIQWYFSDSSMLIASAASIDRAHKLTPSCIEASWRKKASGFVSPRRIRPIDSTFNVLSINCLSLFLSLVDRIIIDRRLSGEIAPPRTSTGRKNRARSLVISGARVSARTSVLLEPSRRRRWCWSTPSRWFPCVKTIFRIAY